VEELHGAILSKEGVKARHSGCRQPALQLSTRAAKAEEINHGKLQRLLVTKESRVQSRPVTLPLRQGDDGRVLSTVVPTTIGRSIPACRRELPSSRGWSPERTRPDN